MAKQLTNKPDFKLYSEEEKLWMGVKESLEGQIKQAKGMIRVNSEFLKVATTELDKLKKK